MARTPQPQRGGRLARWIADVSRRATPCPILLTTDGREGRSFDVFRGVSMRSRPLLFGASLFAVALATTPPAWAQAQPAPAVAAASQTAAQRADALLAQMTQDEKLQLIHGYFPPLANRTPGAPVEEMIPSAGHIPGIARLGIPNIRESDASLGVANQVEQRRGDVATALPAGPMTSLLAGLDADALLAVHREIVARNGLDQGMIYLQLTRGAADRDFPHLAAGMVRLLQDRHVHAPARQRQGGGEAADARADHDDAVPEQCPQSLLLGVKNVVEPDYCSCQQYMTVTRDNLPLQRGAAGGCPWMASCGSSRPWTEP